MQAFLTGHGVFKVMERASWKHSSTETSGAIRMPSIGGPMAIHHKQGLQSHRGSNIWMICPDPAWRSHFSPTWMAIAWPIESTKWIL